MLPGGRYAGQRLFELEKEHIWRKSWLFTYHADEILVATLAGAILTRVNWSPVNGCTPDLKIEQLKLSRFQHPSRQPTDQE